MHSEIRNIAARQFGVLGRAQALHAGLTAHNLDYMVSIGELQVLSPGIYLLDGVPPDPRQPLMAACLRGRRTWLSHRAAAACLGLEGFSFGTAQVTTLDNLRGGDLIIHRTNEMPRSDVTRQGPLQLTTIDRTLADLGAVVGFDAVEVALESALRRRMTHPRRLEAQLARLARRGRAGPKVLRAVLNGRGDGTPPTESWLEIHFVQQLRRYQFPLPDRQVRIQEDNGGLARVDFEYAKEGVVIEVDSRDFHLRRAQWEGDLRRRNMLTCAGRRVLHVTYRRMKSDERGILREIAIALNRPELLSRVDRPRIF